MIHIILVPQFVKPPYVSTYFARDGNFEDKSTTRLLIFGPFIVELGFFYFSLNFITKLNEIMKIEGRFVHLTIINKTNVDINNVRCCNRLTKN